MDIRKLIDKFMEGRTSLEEERLLGEYFRTERDIPEELKPYREMFAYFDRGMTDEDLLGRRIRRFPQAQWQDGFHAPVDWRGGIRGGIAGSSILFRRRRKWDGKF